MSNDIENCDLHEIKPSLNGEFAIDRLLSEFHHAVDCVSQDPDKFDDMLAILTAYNPYFSQIPLRVESPKASVLAQIVAGVYAPLIHGYAKTIVKNIKAGLLPSLIISPPRDAIPLSVAIRAHANMQACKITVLQPPINRNTTGIANNQKGGLSERSPHLELLFDQTTQKMNDASAVVEVETGIYGTTSLVMAKGFKSRRAMQYTPVKFYGLGPNLSFIHAVLSDGQEWIAENAELCGLASAEQVMHLMVLLDTMEELGMERFYKSVEELQIAGNGRVRPVRVSVTPEELQIARVTNWVIFNTAKQYSGITSGFVKELLDKVPILVECAHQGYPFTLTEPIPSMDSKDEHFRSIRESGLFHYPALIL